MKIVFIVNNKGNRLAKVLPKIQGYYAQLNLQKMEVISTQRKKHAIQLAREATEGGCEYLIAVGGDGTLNEVVNGVLQSNISVENYPVIGLLPYGSANDFARTAHISKSLEEQVGLIQSRSHKKIDLGKIVLKNGLETRYFINIAGVGLGPEVSQRLEQSSSVLGPGLNYFRQILIGFLQYAKKEVNCSSSAWQWSGKLLQMAVANGRYFGNGICAAPDARITDGQFQVSIFGDLSMWDYLKNLQNLRKGFKINLPQVRYYNANEVLIESNEPCGIEADGEYVGLAPVTISIVPEAIRFLVPPDVQ
jgi:YegS/Rv2252/BmrU family lipid kinase